MWHRRSFGALEFVLLYEKSPLKSCSDSRCVDGAASSLKKHPQIDNYSLPLTDFSIQS